MAVSYVFFESRNVECKWISYLQSICAGDNKAIMEPIPSRDMGNTPRNNHRQRFGDFVMFADDDNIYTANALKSIRDVVHHDIEALYIFQMQLTPDRILPHPGSNTVKVGDIDSGMPMTNPFNTALSMNTILSQFVIISPCQCMHFTACLIERVLHSYSCLCRVRSCAHKICGPGKLDWWRYAQGRWGVLL